MPAARLRAALAALAALACGGDGPTDPPASAVPGLGRYAYTFDATGPATRPGGATVHAAGTFTISRADAAGLTGTFDAPTLARRVDERHPRSGDAYHVLGVETATDGTGTTTTGGLHSLTLRASGAAGRTIACAGEYAYAGDGGALRRVPATCALVYQGP